MISSYRPPGFSVTITCWSNASRTPTMSFVTCPLQSVTRPAAGELIAISNCTIASCRVWRRFLASPSAGVSLFSGSITALYESAATTRKPGEGARETQSVPRALP